MKNTVTQEQIEKLFEEAEKEIFVAYDKCLVMIVKLPNGFILTESSACVDPANFSREIGEEICIERIKNKLWEMEGYKLQCKVYEEENV